jgi:hypothetical protein
MKSSLVWGPWMQTSGYGLVAVSIAAGRLRCRSGTYFGVLCKDR